jgi:hypothetical protein
MELHVGAFDLFVPAEGKRLGKHDGRNLFNFSLAAALGLSDCAALGVSKGQVTILHSFADGRYRTTALTQSGFNSAASW